ncbi:MULTISPECIES: UDP-N-acetylglucosamine 2-epimerase [Thalassospira]|uniref:UDP-N-acetylglucosamine 2-epimerase n=1 Tax=Thalassospira TaxID=168934 RepID=UPI0007A420D0|nr:MULTISPECIES: UDP-N-acetylglucosamine 2-epimerase [Thalassospira]KZB70930.1 hypothetical protein AUQ43_08765 [Thalassospira sp. MCCC 1A01148]MBR9899351.1 UDP-N-acetylglucosamine 2-epimerase (hydrolyzing) [Rhodospirillales bacterium]
MKKLCFFLTTRGNFGKVSSILTALEHRKDVKVQLAVGGALLDPEYGQTIEEIRATGFEIIAELDYITGSKTPLDISRSAARATELTAEVLEVHRPDVVFLIADRYEVLAFAQAAVCQNVLIAHLEGGEISGSIDERIRHAVSKLAHYHFPANRDAAARLIKMGEPENSIHICGTPSLDLLRLNGFADLDAVRAYLEGRGLGACPSLSEPYVVVSHHPVVTEYESASSQYDILIDAVLELKLPSVWVRPNDDAGAQHFEQAWSRLLLENIADAVAVGGLPLKLYASLLRNSACLIGNSSSGVREAAWLGVPAVNIGSRQHSRLKGQNVCDVPMEKGAIIEAAQSQIKHGFFEPNDLYGDGHSGEKIAEVLCALSPALHKTITY